jgi:hypothetical protein
MRANHIRPAPASRRVPRHVRLQCATALLATVLWTTAACAAPEGGITAAPVESKESIAAQRIFKAIQSVDWNRAEQGGVHDPIEDALRDSGLEFAQFESVNPIPADPGVRLVAKLKKCISLDAWASSLGKPASVNVLLTHSVETVVDKALIQALVTGAERRFGPVVAATYPIPDQSSYALTLLGTHACFDSIRISKKPA